MGDHDAAARRPAARAARLELRRSAMPRRHGWQQRRPRCRQKGQEFRHEAGAGARRHARRRHSGGERRRGDAPSVCGVRGQRQEGAAGDARRRRHALLLAGLRRGQIQASAHQRERPARGRRRVGWRQAERSAISKPKPSNQGPEGCDSRRAVIRHRNAMGWRRALPIAAALPALHQQLVHRRREQRALAAAAKPCEVPGRGAGRCFPGASRRGGWAALVRNALPHAHRQQGRSRPEGDRTRARGWREDRRLFRLQAGARGTARRHPAQAGRRLSGVHLRRHGLRESHAGAAPLPRECRLLHAAALGWRLCEWPHAHRRQPLPAARPAVSRGARAAADQPHLAHRADASRERQADGGRRHDRGADAAPAQALQGADGDRERRRYDGGVARR